MQGPRHCLITPAELGHVREILRHAKLVLMGKIFACVLTLKGMSAEGGNEFFVERADLGAPQHLVHFRKRFSG